LRPVDSHNSGEPKSLEPFAFSAAHGICYCLEAVQRPVHPSDRTNEPEPVRPEKRPVLVQLKPWTDPPVRVAPLGLTDPELKSPEILPLEMTNLSLLLPQGVPTATATHDPSKLPPPLPSPAPPLLLRDARRGSSASGLARRAGFDGSTARGASREPDSDFSSLPMLPPALPDCASAAPDMTAEIISEASVVPIERRTEVSILNVQCPNERASKLTRCVTVSPQSTFRCSHPIAGTCRRRCGRRGGRP
jgi:hypothetical protein